MKKKKFYVNCFHDETIQNIYMPDNRYRLIGLFEECGTTGEGNFCGYYGAEYYVHTRLEAFYFAQRGGIYAPEKRVTDVIICARPIEYTKVGIGSHMWTRVIEADTTAEAFKKFRNADWRRWTSSEDEFTGRY